MAAPGVVAAKLLGSRVGDQPRPLAARTNAAAAGELMAVPLPSPTARAYVCASVSCGGSYARSDAPHACMARPDMDPPRTSVCPMEAEYELAAVGDTARPLPTLSLPPIDTLSPPP